MTNYPCRTSISGGDRLRLMLFTADPDLAAAAQDAGIDRIVVDLERRGKAERQQGYHLETSGHTMRDLQRVRARTSAEVLCRINPLHKCSCQEIEAVIGAGADVLMLPMFRTPDEVRFFVDAVGDRAVTTLLLETREAVACAADLPDIGFDELYVGINDLALAYNKHFAYELFSDGTVEQLRNIFQGRPFGAGGITIMHYGRPIPAIMILQELARMRCSMVILRRAFVRDVAGRNMAEEVKKIRSYYQLMLARTEEQVQKDCARFADAVRKAAGGERA